MTMKIRLIKVEHYERSWHLFGRKPTDNRVHFFRVVQTVIVICCVSTADIFTVRKIGAWPHHASRVKAKLFGNRLRKYIHQHIIKCILIG